MPNRIVREELLDSERWLGLPDNTHRVCFVAVLLRADDCGNLEASEGQLRRLWSAYVDGTGEAEKVVAHLSSVDLIRSYLIDEKRYVHVPRFRQHIRYIRRRNPGSPWDDDEKIQALGVKKHRESSAITVLSLPEVKRSKAFKSSKSKSSLNPKPKPKSNARKRASGGVVFTAPDWLPLPEWQGFIEQRVKLGKSPTAKAKSLLVAKLDRLRVDGHDPKAVLEQSIIGGWAGLFELRQVVGKSTVTGGGGGQWWMSEAATLEQGRLLGLSPRGGEGWNDFRGRIRDKLGAAK